MKPSIVHVLPGKMGGVVSIVANLVAHRNREAFDHHVVLTDNRLDVDARFDEPLGADSQSRFEYELPLENLHAVLRRLDGSLPPRPGILVAHDVLELMMMAAYPSDRTVVQILHGDHDYYYGLATQYQAVIDVFVAYSRTMYEKLQHALPHRRDDVVHLPYGISLPSHTRAPAEGPLRLTYCGRLENGQKGIFDLPVIDHHLRERGCDVEWTVVGDGPDRQELEKRWRANPGVRWLGPLTTAEVAEVYRAQDVFVLPTRREGFPVALVEAMACGLIPVVSDIESGVPEVVDHGRTGFRAPIGDCGAFAADIASIAGDRALREDISNAARRRVTERFDIRDSVRAYEELFSRWKTLRRSQKGRPKLHTGSRLDRRWLPNALVYRARKGIRWLRRPKTLPQ